MNRHSPADPRFDPFWARAEEAGLNIAVHLNYTEYQQQSAMWGEDPSAHYTAAPGFTAFQWTNYWGDQRKMMRDNLAAFLLGATTDRRSTDRQPKRARSVRLSGFPLASHGTSSAVTTSHRAGTL